MEGCMYCLVRAILVCIFGYQPGPAGDSHQRESKRIASYFFRLTSIILGTATMGEYELAHCAWRRRPRPCTCRSPRKARVATRKRRAGSSSSRIPKAPSSMCSRTWTILSWARVGAAFTTQSAPYTARLPTSGFLDRLGSHGRGCDSRGAAQAQGHPFLASTRITVPR